MQERKRELSINKKVVRQLLRKFYALDWMKVTESVLIQTKNVGFESVGSLVQFGLA